MDERRRERLRLFQIVEQSEAAALNALRKRKRQKAKQRQQAGAIENDNRKNGEIFELEFD